MLTPNKEHKKVFPNVPVIGFQNSKSLKDFVVRATLPKLNESGRCDFISTATTFATEACPETFKIQSGSITCDSKKVLYLLKCKLCGEVPYVRKAKTKFSYRFINYKIKHRAFKKKDDRKVPQKLFHTHYRLDGHSGIEDWDFVIFEQCKNTCATETKRNILAT